MRHANGLAALGAVYFRIDYRNGHGRHGRRSARRGGHVDELKPPARTQTVTTGADGLYSFVNLNPGEYRIDAEKTSFKHFKREHINIEVQQSARIDVCHAGRRRQSDRGSNRRNAAAPDHHDFAWAKSSTKHRSIRLPLNGRNVFNLISLAPSVIAQGGSGGSPVGQNPFSWGNYQVGGSFGNESAEYLDGQPLNIGYINLPILIPDQDSISEFKVQYNNLGPEWGKFPAASST